MSDEFNMSIVLDTTPQYITEFELSDFTDGLISRFILINGPQTIAPLQRPKRDECVPESIATIIDDLSKLSIRFLNLLTSLKSSLNLSFFFWLLKISFKNIYKMISFSI